MTLPAYLHVGNENYDLRSNNLPAGYFLAQIGEYQQAPSGNPAVIVLEDEANTVFDDQWQISLWAHNFGMLKNNVASLMGYAKALMNNSSGIGNAEEPRENVITGEKLGYPHPYLDKLRTFALATHAVRDYDATRYQVWAQDGANPPQMKPGKARPRSIADIDNGMVKASDYLYNPQETPWAFFACSNFRTVPGGTTISPFAGGLTYDWTPKPDEPFTWFPLANHHSAPLLSLKSLWKGYWHIKTLIEGRDDS